MSSQSCSLAPRRSSPAPPSRRRASRVVVAGPARAAVALLTVSVVGVAAATTGLWNPPLGDAKRGHPTVASSDVPADQLQNFGVLRRPADSLDRDTLTRRALRDLDGGLEGVRTQRIRTGSSGAQRQAVPDRPGREIGLAHQGRPLPLQRRPGGRRHRLLEHATDSGRPSRARRATRDERSPTNRHRPAVTAPQRHQTPPRSDWSPTVSASISTTTGARVEVHDNVFVFSTDAPLAGAITWHDSSGTTVSKEG